MEENEFNALAEQTLMRIEQALEACGVDLDFELQAGGVLEIELANASKVIVNRHAIAQEIWVAARSGGFHFRWNGSEWVDTRDGEALFLKLSRLLGEQAGEVVRLD